MQRGLKDPRIEHVILHLPQMLMMQIYFTFFYSVSHWVHLDTKGFHRCRSINNSLCGWTIKHQRLLFSQADNALQKTHQQRGLSTSCKKLSDFSSNDLRPGYLCTWGRCTPKPNKAARWLVLVVVAEMDRQDRLSLIGTQFSLEPVWSLPCHWINLDTAEWATTATNEQWNIPKHPMTVVGL